MRLSIVRDPMYWTAKIYLIKEEGTRKEIIGYNGQDLVATIIDDTSPVRQEVLPLLTIPEHMLDELMRLFSEELSKKGYRSTNENFMEGELSATKRHLADMQDLSKALLNKVVNQ